MSVFDLFQQATCEIAAGDRKAAVATLGKALKRIDRTGEDAEMRADLEELRRSVAA